MNHVVDEALKAELWRVTVVNLRGLNLLMFRISEINSAVEASG